MKIGDRVERIPQMENNMGTIIDIRDDALVIRFDDDPPEMQGIESQNDFRVIGDGKADAIKIVMRYFDACSATSPNAILLFGEWVRPIYGCDSFQKALDDLIESASA